MRTLSALPLFGALVLSLSLAGAASASAATTTVFAEDFSSQTPNQAPTGWTTTDSWVVYEFGSASSSDRALLSDMDDPYTVSGAGTTTSPVFDLSSYATATLSFFTYCDTEYSTSTWEDFANLWFGDGTSSAFGWQWDEFLLEDLGLPENADGPAGGSGLSVRIPVPSELLTSTFRFSLGWFADGDGDTGDGFGCVVDDILLVGETDVVAPEPDPELAITGVSHTTDGASSTQATFTSTLTLRATSTVYLSATTTGVLAYHIENASGTTVTTGTTSASLAVATATSGDVYVLEHGDERVLTFTVTHEPTATGTYRVVLDSLTWGTSTENPYGNTLVFAPIEDFRTPLVYLDPSYMFVDTVPPVLTLNGTALVEVTQNASYTELGAKALDAIDGDRTPFIVATGTVDTAVVGDYLITYSVSDIAGNTSSTSRTVRVVAAPPASTGGGGGGGGGSSSSSSDKKAPRDVSLTINGGAATTSSRTVTLALAARDESTPLTMQVSHNRDFSGAQWVTYRASFRWNLPLGLGKKTVYARVKDAKGNVSGSVQTSITVVEGSADTSTKTSVARGTTTGFVATTSLPATVLGASAYRFTRHLGAGSTGEDVRELQELLRRLGLFTFPTSTGTFGPLTSAAVKAYQAARGIPQTGYVGPKTLAALNSETGSNETAELKTLIDLFIALGIIPAEKKQKALDALANLAQ